MAASLAATTGAQQAPAGSFPSDVALITVDAVVVDAQGTPVSGLTRDDFVLKEDGQPRALTSFEAFVQAPPHEPVPAASAVASNETATPSAGRAFALIVDDARLSERDAAATRRALATILERTLRDGDELSLGTSSGTAWWSARLPEGREDLQAVAARITGHDNEIPAPDTLSDYEAFWIDAHESSGGRLTERVVARWTRALVCFDRDPGCPALVRGRARTLEAARALRTRQTLSALHRTLNALAAAPGRKALILFSRGFVEDSSSGLRDLVAAAREVNVAVYFVDVRGLQAQPDALAATAGGSAAAGSEVGAQTFEADTLDSAGARALADDTGGFAVRNTNDLALGAARIAAESRVFYLLGFEPAPGKAPGDWRSLSVELRQPGLHVRARRGYRLSRSASGALDKPDTKDRRGAQPSAHPAVIQAVDAAHDATGLPLRAMAYVFEPRPKGLTHVLVAVELDPSQVTTAADKRGSTRLEISVVVTHRDSGRGFRHDDVLELAPAGLQTPGWRGLTREFELPSGVHQVRVVVRDARTGRLGSVRQRFEVPLASALRVTTPILSDRLAPKQEGPARPRPALAVHRVFAPSGTLYCQFEVLGAERGQDGRPQVLAGLELRTAAGQMLRRADPTAIAADPDGRLVRLVGLGLDGLAEGAYDLVLQVRDEAAGQSLERHEPFSLAVRTVTP